MIIAVLFCIASLASAQTKTKPNCTKVNGGNYAAISTTTKTKTAPKATGQTYTDKDGKVYPVYQGAKGGLYIVRVSKKTGKEYNQYLKTE